jgi:hypothetical protein
MKKLEICETLSLLNYAMETDWRIDRSERSAYMSTEHVLNRNLEWEIRNIVGKVDIDGIVHLSHDKPHKPTSSRNRNHSSHH